MHPSDRVHIFDTTLRDGEQSPGASMTPDEKVRLAHQLDLLGVDVVEAGFPIASPGEHLTVQRIAAVLERAQVAALCRTREADIDTAWDAIKHAVAPRLHVFIATSDIHLEHKLRMSRAEVLEQIRFGVARCARLTPNVEFSAEDATRSDPEFLLEAFDTAIQAGATVLNVPDTVGYTMPEEYFQLISRIKAMIGARPVTISAHCHDDLGLAVANSLAAIRAGARQVECCVNGIGERAGNAALEELVMALHTRRDLMGCTTGIDTRRLVATSRMVSEITGMVVAPNKAIIGRNAFAHESGIHQHGVLAQRETYEIMTPESVGFSANRLSLGKLSGRHALQDRLTQLGYTLTEDQLRAVFHAFKDLADKKAEILDEDLHALAGHTTHARDAAYALDRITVQSGSDIVPSARVEMHVHGEPKSAEGSGDGPVDAAIAAICAATGAKDVKLAEYGLTGITPGSDAQGRVHVLVDWRGTLSRGHGTHTDVVIASAQAFVDALNQHDSDSKRQPAERIRRPGAAY
jgi:2-isopropylmalate synthase